MEHILNRLKSEYSFARSLYYQAEVLESESLEPYNTVTFTELFEEEAIGMRAEMLRNSFRQCFGILDKIAFAICELFELAEPQEAIYFESFWRPRKHQNEKQKQRWRKINSINNPSLAALYSQATDLNSRSGEWGMFKSWRNALEHKILVLTLDESSYSDIYGVLSDKEAVLKVQYKEFRERTLHLLQLTRSAIFNFVFCVRQEGLRDLEGRTSKGFTMSLSKKVNQF